MEAAEDPRRIDAASKAVELALFIEARLVREVSFRPGPPMAAEGQFCLG